VIADDQLLCRPTPLLRVLDLPDPDLVVHPRQPTRRGVRSGRFVLTVNTCPERCPELRNSGLR
jgi:hypothetical protein